MSSNYYWIIAIVSMISFTLINVLSKISFNKNGEMLSYKSFLPVYLAFSAIVVVIIAFIMVGNVYLPVYATGYAALMGGMYCFAAYIAFFSLENEKVGSITIIEDSQFVILSFLSAVLFVQSLIVKDALPSVLTLAGVVLITLNGKGFRKLSRFALFAFGAAVTWVIMWLVFFSTDPVGVSPLVYYAWVAVFTAAVSVPFTFMIGMKKEEFHRFKSRSLLSYVFLAALFNGLGTILFSLAYKLNAVYSPIIVQISVPLVIIISFIVFKEKLSIKQLTGAAAIVASVFILIFL